VDDPNKVDQAPVYFRKAEQALIRLEEEVAAACAEVLRFLRLADEHYAKAVAALPDEHAEADAWAKKDDGYRGEAAKKLIDTCRTEVTRISQENRTKEEMEKEARSYLDLLRNMLPNAPENAEFGKLLGGAAAARADADSEIRRRNALLEERASDSAKAHLPEYDALRKEKRPESPEADDVIAHLESWKGKFTAMPLVEGGFV